MIGIRTGFGRPFFVSTRPVPSVPRSWGRAVLQGAAEPFSVGTDTSASVPRFTLAGGRPRVCVTKSPSGDRKNSLVALDEVRYRLDVHHAVEYADVLLRAERAVGCQLNIREEVEESLEYGDGVGWRLGAVVPVRIEVCRGGACAAFAESPFLRASQYEPSCVVLKAYIGLYLSSCPYCTSEQNRWMVSLLMPRLWA